MNNSDISESLKDANGIGYIIIRTSTAMGAIPVAGAIVNIEVDKIVFLSFAVLIPSFLP